MTDGFRTPPALRPLLAMTRKTLLRLLYPNLAELDVRLTRLEEHLPVQSAQAWDNEALGRRLAALEELVNGLVDEQAVPTGDAE